MSAEKTPVPKVWTVDNTARYLRSRLGLTDRVSEALILNTLERLAEHVAAGKKKFNK